MIYVTGNRFHMDEELDKIEMIIPYTIIGMSGYYGSYFGDSDKYPNEEKFGGTVKRIRNNIFQLQGGCAYLIEGKKLFVFNGGVHSGDPEFDRGVKCLEENQYSFDYVLSNHSMLSAVIYFRHNDRNIDLSKQYFLDKYLVKAEFKQYIFALALADVSLHTSRERQSHLKAEYLSHFCTFFI